MLHTDTQKLLLTKSSTLPYRFCVENHNKLGSLNKNKWRTRI